MSSSVANIAEALASGSSNEPVQVFVRIRPEHQDNAAASSSSVNKENALLGLNAAASPVAKCVHLVDDHTVRVSPPADGSVPGMNRKAVPAVDDKMYTFDRIFPEESSQEELYKHVSTHVKATVRGYNTTIFAYGSTGSGKSFTMTGNHAAPGIIPRAISEIFSIIETTAAQEQDVFFYVRLSYVELYNNNFRNLLEFASKELTAKDINDDGPRGSDPVGGDQQDLPRYAHRTRVVERATIHPSAQRADKIEVRESQSAGVFLAGHNLRIPVTTAQEAFQLIAKGNKNRAVGSTNCNDMSSRSHAILTVHVESRLSASNPTTVSTSFDGTMYSPELRLGKMHLVDLAGSERLALSGAEGETLVETQNINLSLTAIGDVLSALSRNAMAMQQQSSGGGGNAKAVALVPVPYRNSKLTHLLKDSLGGNSKTIMITTIRTSAEYYQQSAVSLMYASRAKKVRNRSLVNRNVIGDTGIHAVTSEIERLKYSLDERSNEFERLRLLQMKEASENVVLKSRLVELNKANEVEKKQLEAQMSNIIHSQAGQLASQKLKISTLQSALESELAQSQNRIAEQEKEITWLKTALQESVKAVQQPKEQIERMQKVVDQWQNQANSSQQELLNAYTTSEALKTEKLDLSAKLSQLQGEYDQLKQHLDKVSAELVDERTTSQQEVKKLRELSTSTAIDRDELKVKFLSSAESCRQRDVIIGKFQQQLKSLEEDIAEHKVLDSSSTEQTIALQSKINQLENEKADLQSKLNNTVKDLEVRTATAIEGAANRLQVIDSKLREEQDKSKKAVSEASRLTEELSALLALHSELEHQLEAESAKVCSLEASSAAVDNQRRQEDGRYTSEISSLKEQLREAESSSKALLEKQEVAHKEEMSKTIQEVDDRLRKLYEIRNNEVMVEYAEKESLLQRHISDEVTSGMQALEDKYMLRIEKVEREAKNELEKAVVSQKKFTTQKWKSKMDSLQSSFLKEKEALRSQITSELESRHSDALRAVEGESGAALQQLREELSHAKEEKVKASRESQKEIEKLRNEIEKYQSDLKSLESDLNDSKERALKELQKLLEHEHANQQRHGADAARRELAEHIASIEKQQADFTRQLKEQHVEQSKLLAEQHVVEVVSLLAAKEKDLRLEFAALQEEASRQSSSLLTKLTGQLQQQAEKEKIGTNLVAEMKSRHAAELQSQERALREEAATAKAAMQQQISELQHESTASEALKNKRIKELEDARRIAETESRNSVSALEHEICLLREEIALAGSKHKEALSLELSGQQQLLDVHRTEVDKLRSDKREAEIRHHRELTSSLDQHVTELAAQRSSLEAIHSKAIAAMSEQLSVAEERHSELVSSRATKQAKDMQLLDQQREDFEQLLRTTVGDKEIYYKKMLNDTMESYESKLSELTSSFDERRQKAEAESAARERALREEIGALQLSIVETETRLGKRLAEEIAVRETLHNEQLALQTNDIANRLKGDISSLRKDKDALQEALQAAQDLASAQREEDRLKISSMQLAFEAEKTKLADAACAGLELEQSKHAAATASLLAKHAVELVALRESADELQAASILQAETLRGELLSSKEEASSYYTNLLRSRLDEEDARYRALEDQLRQLQLDRQQQVAALSADMTALEANTEESRRGREDDVAALEDRNEQLLRAVEAERLRYEEDINLLRSHLDDSRKELLARHDAALGAAKAAAVEESSRLVDELRSSHDCEVQALHHEHRARCDQYTSLISEMEARDSELRELHATEIAKFDEALKASVAAQQSQGDIQLAAMEARLVEASSAHARQLRDGEERLADEICSREQSEEAMQETIVKLQQQLAASEAELHEGLERGRVEIIDRMVEMSAKHDAEVGELKSRHVEELRSVESGSKSALSIEKEGMAEALRAKFIAEYQKLIVDHEQHIEDLNSKHTAEVLAARGAADDTGRKNEELRSSLAELVQATSQTLEQATRDYETELAASKAAYKLQQERLVAEIDSLHSQLASSVKGNESLVVELQSQLSLALDSSNKEKARLAEEISGLRESLLSERQSSESLKDLFEKKISTELSMQRRQLEESASAEASALRSNVEAMQGHLDAVVKENTKLQIQLSERNAANERLLKDVIETKVRDESGYVAQLKLAIEEASKDKVLLQSQLSQERAKCTELEIATSVSQSAKNTAETNYRAALLARDELARSKKEAMAQLEALQARNSSAPPSVAAAAATHHRTITNGSVARGIAASQRPAAAPIRPIYTLVEDPIAAHSRDVLAMEQERSFLQTPQERRGRDQPQSTAARVTQQPAPADIDESRKSVLPWSSPVLGSSPTDQLIAAILDGDVQGVRCVVRSRGEDLTSAFWRDLVSSVLPLHRAVSGLHFHGSERALIATIEALSQLHADANAVDHAGNSPLHKAIQICTSKSVVNVVQALLARGCRANLCNKEGDTPLHTECKRVRTASVEVIEALLLSGADPNYTSPLRTNLNAMSPLLLLLLRGSAIASSSSSSLSSSIIASSSDAAPSSMHALDSHSAEATTAESEDAESARQAGRRVWVRAAAALLRAGAKWDASWRGPNKYSQLHLLLSAFPPCREDADAYCGMLDGALAAGLSPAHEDEKGRNVLFILCERLASTSSEAFSEGGRVLQAVLSSLRQGGGIGSSDRTGRTVFDVRDKVPFSCLSAVRHLLAEASVAAIPHSANQSGAIPTAPPPHHSHSNSSKGGKAAKDSNGNSSRYSAEANNENEVNHYRAHGKAGNPNRVFGVRHLDGY